MVQPFSWRSSPIDVIFPAAALSKKPQSVTAYFRFFTNNTIPITLLKAQWSILLSSSNYTLGHFVRGVKGPSHDDPRLRNRVCDGFMRQNIGTVDVELIVHDHVFTQDRYILHPHPLPH